MKSQFLRNIGATGSTDTNIIAAFNAELNANYQLMLSKLKNFKTSTSTTFHTGMTATLISTGIYQLISTITSTSTTATVTTSAAHGYSNGNVVSITGAAPSGYNGTFTITSTGTNTFTYVMDQAVATSATVSPYFPYPEGEIDIEGVVLTVGSVNQPLSIINSEYKWEQRNAVLLTATQFPQFYYPRRDDFGIWPIPQAIYPGTIYYHYRDRNISVADYNSGTVTVTVGSQLVTGLGTTFTSAMVGRWFTVTDTTVAGQGYWYRVASVTDATHLTLYRTYTGSTSSGITFNIGESPEIPEEGHMTLVDGITAGFYAHVRKDPTNAAAFLNLFYTGDMSNSKREEGNSSITGGLVGLMNRYADRDNNRIVNRKPGLNPLYRMWGFTASN